MKKRLLIICLFLLCGCESKEHFSDISKQNELINNITVDEQPKYFDENPVILSLYDSNLNKASHEYYKTWVMKKDITVFNILLTDDEKAVGNYFQDIWKQYADDYSIKYKIGWYVSFKLSDGSIIDQMIFSPKDVESFYDYLEIYLYDSANVPKDVWYSHLLEKDMNENTIMTTMKLTAGSKYNEISSPITVIAFSYDSDDDFDEEGHYRGNSKYQIDIYNQ